MLHKNINVNSSSVERSPRLNPACPVKANGTGLLQLLDSQRNFIPKWSHRFGYLNLPSKDGQFLSIFLQRYMILGPKWRQKRWNLWPLMEITRQSPKQEGEALPPHPYTQGNMRKEMLLFLTSEQDQVQDRLHQGAFC